MKIKLSRKTPPFHFEVENEEGNTVTLDAAPSIGGQGKGARPMELMLMGLAGCSGIDVGLILEKQRQPLEDLSITVDADRQPGVDPSLFTEIRIHYTFKGDLSPAKVERAIELSLEKYCSVAKIMEATAEIKSSYTLEN